MGARTWTLWPSSAGAIVLPAAVTTAKAAVDATSHATATPAGRSAPMSRGHRATDDASGFPDATPAVNGSAARGTVAGAVVAAAVVAGVGAGVGGGVMAGVVAGPSADPSASVGGVSVDRVVAPVVAGA